MDHTEAIVELKNIISNDFIEKLIPLIDSKANDNLTVGTFEGSKVDTNMRNVKGYHLNADTPTNLFYWNFIKKEIERLYIHYKSKFPTMSSNKLNQIDLLKYSIGGKYEVHTDHHSAGTFRHLSIIMNLNKDYEGGDLVFTDQRHKEIKRLKLDKGSIVFFPSNFMYPHSIEPIIKGTRYSIVAWLQ